MGHGGYQTPSKRRQEEVLLLQSLPNGRSLLRFYGNFTTIIVIYVETTSLHLVSINLVECSSLKFLVRLLKIFL